MSKDPAYTVKTGRIQGDDEQSRTALVVICDAVNANGDVVDLEKLDAIKDDLLLNHRDIVEPHTIVYVSSHAS